MSEKINNPKLIYRNEAKYRYVPVQETLEDDDIGTYVTYGLSVRTVEEEIAFVSDVSTELDEITHLADVCTEKQLAPEHLADVIEDFLAELSLILP